MFDFDADSVFIMESSLLFCSERGDIVLSPCLRRGGAEGIVNGLVKPEARVCVLDLTDTTDEVTDDVIDDAIVTAIEVWVEGFGACGAMRLGDFSLETGSGANTFLFSSALGESNTLDNAFIGPDFCLRD